MKKLESIVSLFLLIVLYIWIIKVVGVPISSDARGFQPSMFLAYVFVPVAFSYLFTVFLDRFSKDME